MSDPSVKINMLIDILHTKNRVLSQVLTITENQGNMLLSAETGEEIAHLWRGVNLEKQSLIDEALQADAAFQNIFESFGADFESYARAQAALTEKMQNLVRLAMALDAKIRTQEQINRELAAKIGKNKKKDASEASKRYVMAQYAKNNRKGGRA